MCRHCTCCAWLAHRKRQSFKESSIAPNKCPTVCQADNYEHQDVPKASTLSMPHCSVSMTLDHTACRVKAKPKIIGRQDIQASRPEPGTKYMLQHRSHSQSSYTSGEAA